MKATPKRPSRTQSERRQETMALLIDASVACLVELGYTHTTTQAVAQKAGLSQGAIFRHFPTRQDLLIATADALADRFLQDFVARMTAAPASATGQEVDTALSVLQAVIASPNKIAWMELQMAARTDEALCMAFRPIFLRCQRESIELARRMFPELLGQIPMAEEVLQLLFQAFVGEAMDAHVIQDPKHPKQMLLATTLLTRLALQQLFNMQAPSSPNVGHKTNQRRKRTS